MNAQIDSRGKTCGVNCACSQGECEFMDHSVYPPVPLQRRRSDTKPGQPVQMRDGLASALRMIAGTARLHAGSQFETLHLAAQTLERDEEENAAMIQLLVNAGYKDIPARVDRELIKRLLGYISPGV